MDNKEAISAYLYHNGKICVRKETSVVSKNSNCLCQRGTACVNKNCLRQQGTACVGKEQPASTRTACVSKEQPASARNCMRQQGTACVRKEQPMSARNCLRKEQTICIQKYGNYLSQENVYVPLLARNCGNVYESRRCSCSTLYQTIHLQ
jgi:hypothetical protein